MTSNVYWNLTLVGGDFDSSALGIDFQKKWQYGKDLDVNILNLGESGALDDLRSKWFQGSSCSQSSDSSTAMTIESMAGLFLTFGIICVLAGILFIWTKRSIIKGYLLTLMCRKKLLAELNVSPTTNSIESTSNDAGISKIDILPTIWL
jgi:hypothetical protein